MDGSVAPPIAAPGRARVRPALARRDRGLAALLGGRGPRLLALLGVAAMAGFFFAFSVVVMPGLALVPPATAMAAMQAINVAVDNALFFAWFFGAPLLCLAVVGGALLRRDGPAAWLAVAGAAVYLVGVFAVTVGFNVPLNDDLARLDPAAPAQAAAMAAYLDEWTAWNHVRTGAGLGAAVLLGLSLQLGRRAGGMVGGGDGAPA